MHVREMTCLVYFLTSSSAHMLNAFFFFTGPLLLSLFQVEFPIDEWPCLLTMHVLSNSLHGYFLRYYDF